MSLELTAAGAGLLMRALDGTAEIHFTKIKIGSGSDAGELATDLSTANMSMDIESISHEGQMVALKASFNNNSVAVGFHMTEVGVFAEDPDDDEAEIMYAYEYIPVEAGGNESQTLADYIPANADRTLETELTLLVYISEAASVTAEIPSGIYAKRADLAAHIGDETKHITAEERRNWNAGGATVGDIKTSISQQSERWLECNGAGIDETDYPDLAELLQTANPQVLKKSLKPSPSAYDLVSDSALINARGIGYKKIGTVERWVICCSGYYNSTTLKRPVIYTTTDLYGEWTEVRLSQDDDYVLVGVCYRSSKWVAFGYKVVSESEYHPYIFQASDPTGEWTGTQIANTNCKVTTGCYADNKLVLLAKSTTGTTAYCYVASSDSTSFNEYTASSSFSGSPKGLTYAGGYWAAADYSTSVWYTNDLTAAWTEKKFAENGIQTFDVCYGGGKWVVAGAQNMGGYGRLWYASTITGTWTDYGVMQPYDANKVIAYSDGVFCALTEDLASVENVWYSTDNCDTFERKQLQSLGSNVFDMIGVNGVFVATSLRGIYIIRHPQNNAVLPELKSALGKTYIRALP